MNPVRKKVNRSPPKAILWQTKALDCCLQKKGNTYNTHMSNQNLKKSDLSNDPIPLYWYG